MREFYDVFADVVRDDAAASKRLRDHIDHRATIANVRELLETGGFAITRVIERESVMRFADGTALLNHYFIKLGFLDAWKKVVPRNERDVFARLRDALDDLASRTGELRLTIPMAYVEATAR
jgi:hypothetical protein